MPETKLLPIFQIRKPLGAPAHPPFALWLTTDERWSEALASGGISNLRRYSLDQSIGAYLQNVNTGNIKERRNRAVSLDYTLQAEDEWNNLNAWETVPTPQEQAQLTAARIHYEGLRNALEAETNLSDEDKELLQGYRNLVQATQLALSIGSNQSGFIEEIPSVFGAGGGLCLHDLNGVPNIPKIRRSTRMLEQDRPFHIKVRFQEPHESQGETRFKMRWGPFVLQVVGGRRVTLSKYKPEFYGTGRKPDRARIAILEAQLDFYLDQGRITADDIVYINGIKDQIAAIRLANKAAKSKPDSPEAKAAKVQIDNLEALIRERKELKQAMPRDAASAADVIKKSLYAFYDEPLNLQESSENFYGDTGILRLTILPQRRGFLTFVLNGGNPVTIDLPDILKTKEYGTVWNETRITLEYNGGAFEWEISNVGVDGGGEYRLKNQLMPFAPTDEELAAMTVYGDWDDSLPGTKITFGMEKSRPDPATNSPGYSPAHPLYDFFAVLRSDVGKKEDVTNTEDVKHTFIPWLYSMRFFLNAGPRPDNTVTQFDTLDYGTLIGIDGVVSNPAYDNPIIDVRLNADDPMAGGRGTTLQIDLYDPNGTLKFPEDGYKNCLCDFLVALWNETDGVHGLTIYGINLVILESVVVNVKSLGEVDPDDPGANYGIDSFRRLSIGDAWALVNRFRIPGPIIFDGQNLGQNLRMGLGLMGWTNYDLAGIDVAGDNAGDVFPSAGPGEKPLKSPPEGMSLGQVMRDLMEDHGVTEDNREMRLSIQDGIFTLDCPADQLPELSPLFNFTGSVESAPEVYQAGAQRGQDWGRFANIFEVQGGIDHLTGEPIRRRYPVLESIYNNAHPLYVGEEVPHSIVIRADLDDAGQVERACEKLAVRHCKSGDMRIVQTWWMYPPRIVGDQGLVDGIVCELARVEDMSIADQTQANLVFRPVTELP